MSKSYLITLPLTLLLTNEELARRGHLTLSFDLLGILSPERMNEMLSQVLTEQGWIQTDNGKLVYNGPNLRKWIIDPIARKLEIDISERLDQEVSVYIYDIDVGPLPLISYSNIPPDIRKLFEKSIKNLQQNEKDILVAEALQARQALNKALNDVYRQALQEKAKSLGNIISVSESTQDGTTRIRIEIS